jgi:hypothetical protein
MQTLIKTSIATGLAFVVLIIFMIWSESLDEVVLKLLITLGILFVVQVIAYLVMRDLDEESGGKGDGTIAR